MGKETLYDAKQVPINKIFLFSLVCVLQILLGRYIHSFNLTNTFYELFRHKYMSPDSHMKLIAIGQTCIKLFEGQKLDVDNGVIGYNYLFEKCSTDNVLKLTCIFDNL